jgi:hypothetical protein
VRMEGRYGKKGQMEGRGGEGKEGRGER